MVWVGKTTYFTPYTSAQVGAEKKIALDQDLAIWYEGFILETWLLILDSVDMGTH